MVIFHSYGTVFALKMVMFDSYVSLLEGIPKIPQIPNYHRFSHEISHINLHILIIISHIWMRIDHILKVPVPYDVSLHVKRSYIYQLLIQKWWFTVYMFQYVSFLEDRFSTCFCLLTSGQYPQGHPSSIWYPLLVGGFKHLLCSISYMECHPSHWRSPSFFKMFFQHVETTNQIIIYSNYIKYIYGL